MASGSYPAFLLSLEIDPDISRSIKTYEALTAAGIPCTVVLDSAVAYVMDSVDFVLVGSEAVVESGGLINAVGSHQMAIIAKAANKPFYALAERSDHLHAHCMGELIPSCSALQLQIPSIIPIIAI